MANLNQLQYFVCPKSGAISASLPAGQSSSFAIEQSLEILGIDASLGGQGDVMVEGAKRDALGEVGDDYAGGNDILFDEAALQKLIDAGVTSPLLTIVKQK